MLQLHPVYSLWNRCKTLTGSPDPMHTNGTNKLCRNEDPELQNYFKTRKSLCIVETLLDRKVQLKNHSVEMNQFVLPAPHRKHTVLACHDEMGYLGMDRTLLLLLDRVYWPGMSKDVREHIRTCDRCEHFKKLNKQRCTCGFSDDWWEEGPTKRH